MAAALLRTARDLQGAYAVACVGRDTAETLVAICRGSPPLVVGFGHGEMFLTSDIPALLGVTRDVLVLEEGELATLTRDALTLLTTSAFSEAATSISHGILQKA